MESREFVAIGDIVIDAFIRLNTESAHIDIDHEERELSMKFGTKIPYHEKFVVPAVGNSGNAAVAASRLGLGSAIVTSVGGDRQGQDILDRLTQERVGTEFVAVHADMPTNYHYVLWYQDERTILIRHEPYPYVLPEIGAPQWIYLSSTSELAKDFHGVLTDYLQKNPGVKLAFQPGTFQMSMGTEFLKGLYARTEIFFCNREEAAFILNMPKTDMRALLNGIRALGVKIAVITDGPTGAYAMSDEGAWFVPVYPDIAPPYERTGAGDAFATTVTAALGLGKPLQEALLWGPVNSMMVVQKVGAQEGLLDRAGIEAYLAKAPADYVLAPLP